MSEPLLPSPPVPSSPLRLVVVGGGHASLPLLADAGRWVRAGVDVTLVSDAPDLWYSGMTPEWLGGVYTRDDVTVGLGAICAREGVRFEQSTATHLDLGERRVQTLTGEAIRFDALVLDVGAANPGTAIAPATVRTKPLHRIEALGSALDDGVERLAIVGGGAAGVECALNVTARRDAPRVVLLEPADALVAGLPSRVGRWAHGALRSRGAVVRLGARVERAGADGVELASGERVRADAVLWATGSVGPPWLAGSGLPVDARGFVRVRSTLQAQGHDDVFVAGDAAVVDGHEDLARIGVHAVKQGATLRTNVGRWLDTRRGAAPRPLAPFRPYPVAPLILSTGTPAAWIAAGPVALRTRAALGLKHAVDRRWIRRYRRRPLSTPGLWDLAHAGDATPATADR